MKLPAFFGHKKSINLLPRDSFENSTLGAILEWSLVFGKWAVIVTQLIVMGAFLYRFTLDRQLTDLRKAILKDVAIVKSYDQVERDYILAQKRVEAAKEAIQSQNQALEIMAEIVNVTPNELWYDKINITNNSLSMTAYASSLSGFAQFMTLIQKNPAFKNIRIAKLETSSTKGAQIQFEISSTLGSNK